ncbi:MAG: hypothetical protein ACLVJH_06645 [Faecalibacterium prausnitzii]
MMFSMFCSLIETIARKTKNHRQDVIRHFTKADIERQLRLAEVNHCLSFEQVSDELIDDFNIPDGDFDTARRVPLYGSFCNLHRNAVSGAGAVHHEE